MKAVSSCCALSLAVLLSACAAPPPASEPAPAAAEAAQPVAAQDQAITGSRIPGRRTEKMVSAIGSKDYRENKESLVAPLRSQ